MNEPVCLCVAVFLFVIMCAFAGIGMDVHLRARLRRCANTTPKGGKGVRREPMTDVQIASMGIKSKIIKQVLKEGSNE